MLAVLGCPIVLPRDDSALSTNAIRVTARAAILLAMLAMGVAPGMMHVAEAEGAGTSANGTLSLKGTPPPADVFVSPSGSESGDGSGANPWPSITFAIGQVAGSATAERPVTIHLARGTYRETVVLAPNVFIAGADANDRGGSVILPTTQLLTANAFIAVIAAQNSGLRDLTIRLPLTPLPLTALVIDDVVAMVENVLLDGSHGAPYVGINILNLGSSNARIVDSEITGFTLGVRAIETNASITRSRFSDIGVDALTLYRPEGKGAATSAAPMLGSVTDLEGTGQNSFDGDSIRKSFINNLNENTVLMAEGNEWGSDDFEDINEKMEGEVDFLPYRLSSNATVLTMTLAVEVTDFETRRPVEDAVVSLMPPKHPPVSERVDNAFVFQAIPLEQYTVVAEAAGYMTDGTFLRNPAFTASAAIALRRSDSITEEELVEIARELLESTEPGEIGAVEEWDYAAASATVADLSLSQFEILDLDGDGLVTVEELEKVDMPQRGCCVRRSASKLKLAELLGDFFLLMTAFFVLMGYESTLRKGRAG